MFVSLRSHGHSLTPPHPLLSGLGRLLVRVRRAPTFLWHRIRRLTPEHILGALMVAALVLFFVLLFTQSTSVGRGGR